MAIFDLVDFDNHEQVVYCSDDATGLKAIIAVHSTALGPAAGGCRFWDYVNDEAALTDVLRLSKGMTYKNAMAGLKLGGGKGVIIGNPRHLKSDDLFKAYGKAVNNLGGRYYTAEDVNITTGDMAIVNQVTDYVSGLEGKSGNPGPFTALGTFLGIKAAVKFKLGSDDLSGIKVAVQGLGSVGYSLCERLHAAGAKLIVTDINQEILDKAVTELDATVVSLDDIYKQDVEVFSPCALGASINDDSIAELKAVIIAGCANNQLAESRHDQVLLDKGILYAPDYVINAGGIINVALEIYPEPYCADKATSLVENIYHTLMNVFVTANEKNLPTGKVADEMARAIIANAGK
ncbi:Leu/Phe/Val dehydrogenase [Colwellia hornerae]|uniref:Glu/Leu/Phe/Val dehydrogenase n=1 Tax=Colwellia hornerae TaxID=89402 RepID=A0A5C6QEX1_9GAMM|nr:Glu/Leu/Phe/Val dehydrogenase dimerization domain-containing protein [Colwellia hornerae]TWX52285.1 Glu/Leu/Phe/Val dehydrogenase [Colwellia hornerae]TWX57844.1 Glu/Leu/Phe/Val dehydrogenase [Colwellia hornerae]TWX67546.1 Glu/Leu/Phe/Val dehydrogenase [Colwellia hornerae]